MIFLIRILALVGTMLIVMNACGRGETITPTARIDGPALIFFYTDP
jgi:hypothetical protein